MATPETADCFRREIRAAVTDLTAYRRRQSQTLAKRKTELVAMQDRLNAYLAGTGNGGLAVSGSARTGLGGGRDGCNLASCHKSGSDYPILRYLRAALSNVDR